MSAATGPTGTLDVALAHAARLLGTQPALAAEQAHEILKVVPDHAPAVFLLGRALAAAGRGDEAIRALRRTVELKPDHAEAWRLLADHLHAIGDDAGAENAYARHVQCSTRNPQCRRVILRFAFAKRSRTAGSAWNWPKAKIGRFAG